MSNVKIRTIFNDPIFFDLGPTIVRSSSVSSTCSSASSSTSAARSDRKRRCRSTGSEEPLKKVDKTEAVSGAEDNDEDMEITFTTTKGNAWSIFPLSVPLHQTV